MLSGMSADVKTRVGDLQAVPAVGGEACLVRIYPPDAELGRKFELAGGATIGRDPSNTIAVESDLVSRRHAEIAARAEARIIRDLGSTNGTYVNGAPITETELRSGDLVKVGDVIFKFLHGGSIEALYHEEIYRMTIIDGLTEAYNKRYLLEHLEREISRCRRYGRRVALLLFDVDRFKQVNDAHGHLAGDAVLRELAGLVRRRIRREELFARYGGEEFVVVIPEATREAAAQAAESIRRLAAEHRFVFDGTAIPVTISVGVGLFDERVSGPLDLLRAADENLYKAKHAGRNCVVA